MWYTSAFFANSRRKCIIDSLVKGLILGLKSRAKFLSFFSPISQNLVFSLLNLSFLSWLKRFFALVAVSSIFLVAQWVEANFFWKMKVFQPLLAFQNREPFSSKIHPSPFNRKVLKTGEYFGSRISIFPVFSTGRGCKKLRENRDFFPSFSPFSEKRWSGNTFGDVPKRLKGPVLKTGRSA